jgi:outer membrane protein TolC
MLTNRRTLPLLCLCAGMLFPGCSASHYRKSADKEAYKIIGQKQTGVFGRTNAFSIDTRYSGRDPEDIKSPELIQERLDSAQRKLTLAEALKLAIENSRTYQTQKETLYLSALTLTGERHDFNPQFFGSSRGTVNRESNGDRSRGLESEAGFNQFLKSGGRLGVAVANDILRYYTGGGSSTRSAVSMFVNQPLLRGAGASIAAESLTQAERNVIYAVRSFSRFQNTFAVDTLTSYYRLLQQKDTVRNEYNNYRNLVLARERAEAMAKSDRLPAFQADQASQDELSAKSRYILAVESYRATLDNFKLTLGLPTGIDLTLDDSALEELANLGLSPVNLAEANGYEIAVARRLDLINEIDKFEDFKRKIKVAANSLKADLNIFADAGLDSRAPSDYTKFNLNDYRAGAGVQLNLPFDRLPQRNSYRRSLIEFEVQIRKLSLELDNVRGDVRQGLRALDQNRQTYEIQKNAVALADRRVESATLLQELGRAQIRDLLDARTSLLQARNAVTKALVDYHVARLNLMIDIGVLDTGEERFWVLTPAIPNQAENAVTAAQAKAADAEVISPEQLFGK